MATSLWVLMGAVGLAIVGPVSFPQTVSPPSIPPHSILLPEVNRPPDANEQMKMREKQGKSLKFDVANAERLRQMSKDSEALVILAMALKAEVDDTPPGKLSPNVYRKAETIEKLARAVADKMKLTMGAN